MIPVTLKSEVYVPYWVGSSL